METVQQVFQQPRTDDLNVTSAVTETESDETPYYRELNRLFGLYRLANLNARYYGHRTAKFQNYTRWSLILGGGLSAVALTVLLSSPPSWDKAKLFAVVAAGVAAVTVSIAPSFGWTEKSRELNNLHFSYSQLFGQLEFVITEIRRADNLSQEHVGMARMVHEAFMRVETMDELDPDGVLIEKERSKVALAFPENYLWTHF